MSSENSSFCKQRAGLHHKSLHVHTYNVEHGQEVLRAEQAVCKSKAQRGGDEPFAILHHPGPSSPLHGGGVPHFMNNGVTCWERRKNNDILVRCFI